MSMQPSEDEILREVEALRDIKRRSTAQGGPGTLTIDPDLPELLSSQSNTLSSSTWPGPSSASDSMLNANTIDDPSHLFWVPARLHPEIAPQEFREFLKDHARDVVSGSQGNDPNSLSPASTTVSRRRSMLSRQYKPTELDGVENEHVVIRRNTTSRATPQLTINDLQKLDEIAQAVSEGDDPSKISTMLRRSLSVSTSSTGTTDNKALDMDDPDSPIIVPLPNQILRRAARTKIRKPSLQGDGGGHRFPSSRRGTRSNTIGTTDGSENDHGDSQMIQLTSEADADADTRPFSYTDETSIFDSYSEKRESLTSSESPDRSEDDHRFTASPPPLQIPPVPSQAQLQLDLPDFELSFTSTTPPSILHEPIPQRDLLIPAASDIPLSRSPSPTPSDTGSVISATTHQPTPSSSQKEIEPSPDDILPLKPRSPRGIPSPASSPSPSRKEKEKEREKKGLFGKWGGDKKKTKIEVGRTETKDSREREKEKEKDSSFFGSLFGGKKKPEESSTGSLQGATSPATTAALLAANRANKTNIRSPSPQPPGSYARYPIHVERAIYRLSHIKLANARRPLLEQVLISNLMFWYLSIINKPTTTSPPAAQNQTFEQIVQSQAQGVSQEKDASQDNGIKGRESMERERQDNETKERSDVVRRENGRKGNLNRGGKPAGDAGARRAEVSVRGPQYESQYRSMEQEYANTSSFNHSSGGYSNQVSSPHVRTGSAPPAPMTSSPVYQQYANQKLGMTPQQMAQIRATTTALNTVSQPGNFYYNNDTSHLYHPQPVHQTGNSPYGLPPGAMSPQLGLDKSWHSSPIGSPTNPNNSGQGPYIYNPSPSPSPPPNSTGQGQSQGQGQRRPSQSQSPPPRRPRSPPPQGLSTNSRSRSVTPPNGRGSRSVSAETFPGGTASAKLRKKTNPIQTSNADSLLQRRTSDSDSPGDDVPLAVWQQQHRASSGHQSGDSV